MAYPQPVRRFPLTWLSSIPSSIILPRCSPSPSHTHTQLVELLSDRVPPGVDEAAYPKAAYLSALALGTESPTLISRSQAIELLGTMQGGYNGKSCVVIYFLARLLFTCVGPGRFSTAKTDPLKATAHLLSFISHLLCRSGHPRHTPKRCRYGHGPAGG